MRKSELVRTVADETHLTQVKAEDAVEAILDEIKAALSRGDEVILRRFGAFSVRAKEARPGRNPKTGEPADIGARYVVRFKPGKQLRAAVNQPSGTLRRARHP
jgi:integration host factor beta subunit